MNANELKQRLTALESELAALKSATSPRRPPSYGGWGVAGTPEPLSAEALAEQAAMAERHALMPAEIQARRIYAESRAQMEYRIDQWMKLDRPPDLRAVRAQLAALEKQEAERRALPQNARAVELCDLFEQHELEQKKLDAVRDARIVAEAARARLSAKQAELEQRRGELQAQEADLERLRQVAEGAE